jgi:site-specific DNA-methyltransferase (adenine-specific)
MEQQETLDLKIDRKFNSVEEYKFEPIKGYPMLHWKGKRPFTSTQYYPAQLKESHGTEVNGWINKIFWGDNLQVMSHLLKEYRGKVDLIYIDPPFDSKIDYKKEIKIRGHKAFNDINVFEEKQYSDIWTNDEYLQFMYERLILIRELLSDKGSIFLHCDWHKVHHLRCILDELFGSNCFRNEIIWGYHGPGSPGMRQFNRKHDNILWYTKTSSWIFNDDEIRIPHDEKTVDNFKEGLKGSGFIGDNYEIPQGKIPEDYWVMAIAARYPNDGVKRIGYPTEKPFPLLERIIKACSKPDSIVFDCFMGSGVFQAMALKHGRKFLGADINLGSIQTTTKRLLITANKLQPKQSESEITQISFAAETYTMYGNEKKQKETILYTGFEVYNVNYYDVFRNPVEAKDLLIKALEIQPLPNNSIYDGEKDGRMVKIMPVNRIATRADLNELITGFDYKQFEKRNDQNPGKAVESLLLVCMGHEPDLAAYLSNEVPYKLDVEVVDILRDKSNLEFKRDSEAEITVEGGKLLIREFFPMNLLQKLSLMKENVEDWRELVESVMIDFNYDGAVFEPTLVDVPGKNDLVKGNYPVPTEAGMIRVKITDLLSESLEVIINHG